MNYSSIFTILLTMFSISMWMMFGLYFNWGLWLSLDLSNVFDMNYSVSLILDKYSVVFMLMTSSISSLVLMYSKGYMKDDTNMLSFFITMFLFIMSMIILSVSNSSYWVMIGWDGLGLSSFMLISYFENWTSMNNATVTFMMNRMGDVFLFMTMGFMISSLSINSFQIFSLGYLSLIIVSMTKSAQLPFSAWLPMAMAAPTPVSSLVHSSTLVTAGVYLLVRFNKMSFELNELTLLSSLTFIIAGLSALNEFNLKKIIAMSTMSHMGLIFFFISLGFLDSAMTHLLMHAVFKSSLFMTSGLIIHNMDNNQDIRQIKLTSSFTLSSKLIVIPILSMAGTPFTSGFVSKEQLFKSLLSNNFSMIYPILFMIAVMLTVMYSARLIKFIMIAYNNPTVIQTNEHSNNMINVCYWGSILSTSVGGLISWTIMVNTELYDNFISKTFTYSMFFVMLISLLVANSSLWNSTVLNNFCYCNSVAYFTKLPFFYLSNLSKFVDYSGFSLHLIYNYLVNFTKFTKFNMLNMVSLVNLLLIINISLVFMLPILVK